MANNFFSKNGKAMRGMQLPKPTVVSLIEVEEFNKQEEIKTNFLTKLGDYKSNLNINMNAHPAILGVFVAIIIGAFVFLPSKAKPRISDRYSIYAATPLTIEESTQKVATKDSRAQKIDGVFKEYACPMEGMGNTFVEEADKNGIPWWLVASVSFQESGCGKKAPVVDGVSSYNAWGWGIYGDNLHMFENWARGVERVSRYFGENFYSQGVTDTCEIMKTYTPPSNGSWCYGVNHFAEIFQNYKSPDSK